MDAKEPSGKWGRIGRKTAITLGLLAVLGVVLGIVRSFNNFSHSLDSYYGVKPTDNRSEVQYRLGEPVTVSNGDGQDFLNGTGEGIASIPNGKTIRDFSRWQYRDAGSALVAIEFQKDHVASVSCLTETEDDSCAPIAGIGSDDSEEKLLAALGAPSKLRVSRGSKALKYDDLGVSYGLVKGKVIATQMRSPRSHLWARLYRWSIFKPKSKAS